MRIAKAVFDFYINSSIHVALAAVSMACVTLLDFGIPYDWSLLFFIFFASITGYNFVKYFGLAKFHHRRLAGWLQFIQVFSIMCFAMMCIFGAQLERSTLLFVAVFAGITFLYSVPLLPKSMLMDTNKNLRSISGLKIYVIALVWAGVTVLLPLLNNNYSIDTEVWLTTFQRFLIVIVLILPFEIRDLQYDSLRLSTIPQQIGVNNTKALGAVLGILFLFLEFLREDSDLKRLIISLTILIIAVVFLVAAKRDQNMYYSSFWVESIPMLWLLLHIVF